MTSKPPGKKPESDRKARPFLGIRWSISSKLMMAAVSLLSLVVAFLTTASISLLTSDKRAYVFEAQTTTATLAGREFVSYARTAVDLVRQTLSWVDADKPGVASSALEQRLQVLLSSQSLVFHLQVGTYRTATGDFIATAKATRTEEGQRQALVGIEALLTPEVLRAQSESLRTDGVAFYNLSRIGQPPLLGLVVLNRGQTSRTGNLAMSFGTISIANLQAGVPASIGALAIYTMSGSLLFHSDSEQLYAASVWGDGARRGLASSQGDPVLASAREGKTATSTREMTIDGTSYLTTFHKPGLGLVATTRLESAKAMKATYALTERLLVFGLLASSLATIVAIVFSRSLTSPLTRLFEATKEVSKGNFSITVPVHSQDEIGALGDAFNAMSKKISELVRRMVDQVRVEQELAVASTVQSNLIPLPTYADQQIRIRGYYKSANQCGGDWWEFFRVGDQLAIFVADATGHGIPSALMTASVKGCFSTIQRLVRMSEPKIRITPQEIIPIANSAVFESGRGKIHMTFFMAVIDFRTGKLTYANAGHNPPWLARYDQHGKARARLLNSAGPRLGELAEITSVKEHQIDLAAGDLLVFYTDGLTEAENPARQMFGKKRVRKIIEGHYSRAEAAVLDALVAELNKHQAGRPLQDDVTLVGVSLLPGAFQKLADDSTQTFGSGGITKTVAAA